MGVIHGRKIAITTTIDKELFDYCKSNRIPFSKIFELGIKHLKESSKSEDISEIKRRLDFFIKRTYELQEQIKKLRDG
jgi:t-SNARE complex subunit (syntaxin)